MLKMPPPSPWHVCYSCRFTAHFVYKTHRNTYIIISPLSRLLFDAIIKDVQGDSPLNIIASTLFILYLFKIMFVGLCLSMPKVCARPYFQTPT